MHDADDLTPLRLVVPTEFAANRDAKRAEQPRFVDTEITDMLPRTPQHRRQPTSAAKGRVMIVAMAAGAAAAAAYTAIKPAGETTTRTVLAAEKTSIDGAACRARAACRSSPSSRRPTPRCTTRNSPRARRSPRSAPSAKHGCSGRCS